MKREKYIPKERGHVLDLVVDGYTKISIKGTGFEDMDCDCLA